MNRQDAGKIAVVTGAAQGLGMAVARALVERGAHVVVADIQEDLARAVAESLSSSGGSAEARLVDIADPESVDALYTELGLREAGLDYAVHNAGVGQHVAPMRELADEEWQRVLRVTLSGTFYCCRAAARIMHQQGQGSIVNIASINGQEPAAQVAAYNAAKAGVISLTRTLAMEEAPYGVRVNAVCPGPVYTEFNRTVMAERGERSGRTEEEMKEQVRSSIPLGRWGEPEDIAEAVVFLLGPQAGWITGEMLAVSGGLRGVGAPPRRAAQ